MQTSATHDLACNDADMYLTIVPVNEVMTDQEILEEHVTFLSLAPFITDTQLTIKWLAKHKLLANSVRCTYCDREASLIRYSTKDGIRWACCNNFRRSIRHGSFFSNSKIALTELLVLLYKWTQNTYQYTICHETNRSKKTVIDWCNFLREVCMQEILGDPAPIGGINLETNEPLVVEIDETKFFHRKYHRGEWREGHWIFGGVERETKKCFMTIVPDRTTETLFPIIEQWILPGTHIISDGWRAYQAIPTIQQGIYSHAVVNHSENFVDPDDFDTHTQSVEGFWKHAKKKLRYQHGTSEQLFPSYLFEFLWRWKLKPEDSVFGNIIVSIIKQYSV